MSGALRGCGFGWRFLYRRQGYPSVRGRGEGVWDSGEVFAFVGMHWIDSAVGGESACGIWADLTAMRSSWMVSSDEGRVGPGLDGLGGSGQWGV